MFRNTSPTGNKVFKNMSLLGAFLIQTSIKILFEVELNNRETCGGLEDARIFAFLFSKEDIIYVHGVLRTWVRLEEFCISKE